MTLQATNYKAINIRKMNLMLVVLIILWQVDAQNLTWQDYPQIENGRVSIYTGPQLVSSLTPIFNTSQTFTLNIGGNPKQMAIGITTFQMPQTQDFYIATTKDQVNPNNIVITVDLQANTVIYVLKFDYLILVKTSNLFNVRTYSFSPSTLTSGVGYRSENDVNYINRTNFPIFNTVNLISTLVLQGFGMYNPTGTYFYLDSIVHLPAPGTINTTFITNDNSVVSYIKYAIIFFDQNQAEQTTQLIAQLGFGDFNSTTASSYNFFNGIRARYIDPNRMFFGVSSFNFTRIWSKNFALDTSNTSNLYSTYTLSNIDNLKLSYFFFVGRSCSGGSYFYNNWTDPSLDACVNDCSVYVDRPTNDNGNSQCTACDNTCLTCQTNAASDCLSCDATIFRQLQGASPSPCDCMSGYVPVPGGGGACAACSSYMTGCDTCSSTSSCTSCITGFTGTTSCSCASNSIVSGYCNTVSGCITITVINGTQTCTTCNSTLLFQLTASFQCACVFGSAIGANSLCYAICGDNYVLSVEGCDDGNLVDGDGCSSQCTVETSWSCTGTLAQGSTCAIANAPTLSYVGALRDTSSNRAQIYYQLTPYFINYNNINWSQEVVTTIPHSYIQVTYNQNYQMLKVTVDYTSVLQRNAYSLQINLNNSNFFTSSTNTVTAILVGANAELTFDDDLWIHNILRWIVLFLVIAAVVVFVVSIGFEKWIGLELIQTYQGVFFILAFGKGYPFQFTALTENMKYSNGYDDVFRRDYEEIYSLPNNLIGLSKQKQFLSNYNINFIFIFLTIIAMIVIALLRKKYQTMLEQAISSSTTKKIQRINKIFAFVFSRIFQMIIFFSMFQIIFAFCQQLSNHTQNQQFPDEVNVIAGMIAFVFVFSMISFVIYWYLLLPEHYSEEKEFMCLKFQNMMVGYPIIYLLYQTLFILTISIFCDQESAIYAVLGIQVIYLVILIVVRPYNTVRNCNRFLHNITIIWNQLVLISVLIIVLRWNQLYGTENQIDSKTLTVVLFFLVIFFLIASLILAIVRLCIFNKDVSCRKQEQREQQSKQSVFQQDQNTMRKLDKERYGALLNVQQKQEKNIELQNLSGRQKKISRQFPLKQEQPQPQPQKRKRKISNEVNEIELNDTILDKFMNEDYMKWTKKPTESRVQSKSSRLRSNIKKTTNKSTAELKKSDLDIFKEVEKQIFKKRDN